MVDFATASSQQPWPWATFFAMRGIGKLLTFFSGLIMIVGLVSSLFRR